MGALGIALARRHDLRQRLQVKLGQMVNAYGSEAAAGGIAGLIGRCSVEEALAQAGPRFRSINLHQLTYHDLVHSPIENVPDSGLFRLTEPCVFGECDAFVSHSWHDPMPEKWAALQNWRANFLAENGREPRIWLDKACINQNDIEADLRGLPIFLSGCTELLVLVGPTYLKRLWCILELFTFVHMGGDVSRVKPVQLIRDDQEECDRSAIHQSIQAFDAKKCECFCQNDKEKMLTIIMTAFGDMDSFNGVVRKLMLELGLTVRKAGRKELLVV